MRRLTVLLFVGIGLALWLIVMSVGLAHLASSRPFGVSPAVIFVGLALWLVTLIQLVIQQGLRRIRHSSVARARQETVAEHHRFLRRLDHEMKNPLTAILVGISNLREMQESEGQQQVLSSIEMQTMRLSRLVMDLRKLAELETLPFEEAPFDLREMLQEAALLVQERSLQDQQQLSLVLPALSQGALNVVGDRDLLLLVIHNLLDNALKFSRPEDSIALRAYRDGSNIVIEVSDTGPGIRSADAPLVWEELYRGQNTDGIPGSGIGLTLVQIIVKRSRGEVHLESELGKGTTVTIRLPAVTS